MDKRPKWCVWLARDKIRAAPMFAAADCEFFASGDAGDARFIALAEFQSPFKRSNLFYAPQIG